MKNKETNNENNEIKNKKPKKAKKQKMNFVRTTDFNVAEHLRASGYTELTEKSSACYCFLNDGKLLFEGNEEMEKNMHYTNIMCI